VDAMPGEVALLCRAPCRLELHGDFEPCSQESGKFFGENEERTARRFEALMAVSSGSPLSFHGRHLVLSPTRVPLGWIELNRNGLTP